MHMGASRCYLGGLRLPGIVLRVLGGELLQALLRAHEGFEQLGASPLVAMVGRRLRERGIRVPRGPRAATRANPAELTGRELDVLELLADGLRNAEIAERLFLSTRTVDHHVASIRRKLDAASRGQAVAEARRLGLLQDR